MKRTLLRRYMPRIGKHTGKVRLSGEALRNLRRACWERDQGLCHDCGNPTYYEARYDGDLLAYDMSHVKSRGAGGSDALENVVCKHHACHLLEHAKGRNEASNGNRSLAR
jgi:5-methylcytosine-specific restriction endonuclease McrA